MPVVGATNGGMKRRLDANQARGQLLEEREALARAPVGELDRVVGKNWH